MFLANVFTAAEDLCVTREHSARAVQFRKLLSERLIIPRQLLTKRGDKAVEEETLFVQKTH